MLKSAALFLCGFCWLYTFHTTAQLLTEISGLLVGSKKSISLPNPPNFPSNIPLRLGTYENWANELSIQDLWIATPSHYRDIVTLANWAYANNFTLRASGYMHNWSPLTVTKANRFVKNVVLVDTKAALIRMALTQSPYANTMAVQVQTGVTVTDLLTFLEENGLGVYAVPAPGGITIGGALAIGGHGTSVPAIGETEPPGFSYGTISNLVISLTAVVWDPAQQTYGLKTFRRSETETKAFLVHLGRTFLTEATLMVGPNYNLRCISRTDIPSDELFADPTSVNADTRTFARFLNESGRIETILFPFTGIPWLKVWSICPNKPRSLLTRTVTRPYNYIVPNTIPEFLSMIVGNASNSIGILNPLFGTTERLLASVGNLATLSFDIWGKSKNLLLYVKETTIRQTACGYAIITTRGNVQRIVSRLTVFYNHLLRDYASKNLYPINGVIEMRASALDYSNKVVPDGESPSLSVLHPVDGHPEYDTAIWLSILSYPYSTHQNEAYQTIESFIFREFHGVDSVVRVEWSKGFAYSLDEGGWTAPHVLNEVIPSTFPATSSLNGWNYAISVFDKYDPHRIFSNTFLDQVLVKESK
ncbi:uncharacterized protein LOC119077966 [Bradysia coprophila]|uniref:uncharacterized protein LOC119077966 n=1 Tax=Bradysia coprophila TaxID=38358 RepID=UPI00187DDA9B|nr:uncharacterized protein LOC119077966 [Bradysia coprophila]